MSELGVGSAGAERGDGDAAALQFIGDRLAKTEHVGFARTIDGHLRARLKPGHGGHQHDPAFAPGHHRRKQQPGQLGQRHDVDLQHLADPERIGGVEPAVGAETGRVDQHLDGQTLRLDLPHQSGDGPTLAEVGGNDGAIGAESLQFIGQNPHRLEAPGGQNQVVTVFGQFTRQIGADAAGGAGDEGEGASIAFHDSGSERIRPMEAAGILEFATPVVFTSTANSVPFN